jgi:Bacterial Ig domain
MSCVSFKLWALAIVMAAVSLISASGQPGTLVTNGSVWKFFDGGFEPVGWKALNFDDTGWLMGPGELGFGDGDESTLLNRTNTLGETNITFYFRRKFTLSDPSAFSNLLVRIRRDDGAVVYLNEVEVFRSNLPLGPIFYATLAPTFAADDGQSFYANSVSTGLLLTDENILAVEVHQNALTSSDISFDLELKGNVIFQPPTVSITSPRNGESLGSSNLLIVATNVFDSDGLVTSVEFFDGTSLLGAITNAPFIYTITNVSVGSYLLTAIATDNTGLSATSAPVAVVVAPRIVPSGAGWRFLDDGSNQGTAWREPLFDDSGWSNGPAQLGFGDGDEVTLINRTNAAGGTNITSYFRHRFQPGDAAVLTNLVLRVLRDDGAIVYLNGIEVFRSNMPTGAIDYLTTAVDVVEDNFFHAVHLIPSLLMTGENVLAVEIHQVNATSRDLSFDLELRPNVPPTPPEVVLLGPAAGSQYFGPTNVTLTAAATDLDDPVASISFYAGNTFVGNDTVEPFSLVASNLPLGTHEIRAVAFDAMGLSATSAPVWIEILRQPLVTTLIATGSVWKYLDTGVDQGTNWRGRGFDDSSWFEGTGKFGTNDPAATIINISPINRTAYFRNGFSVSSLAGVTNLGFQVLRDDGVVAYLNGVEIFRMNMPTGAVSFSTFAATAVGGSAERAFFPTNIAPNLLSVGSNVLAVELHQSQNTSDAGFDLSLVSIAPPPPGPPPVRISFSALPVPEVILTWPGGGSVLQSAPEVIGPFADILGASSPYAVPPTNTSRFFRLRDP